MMTRRRPQFPSNGEEADWEALCEEGPLQAGREGKQGSRVGVQTWGRGAQVQGQTVLSAAGRPRASHETEEHTLRCR